MPLSVLVVTPNDDGFSWDWTETRQFPTESEYRLCRCGQSRKAPYCDDVCKTSGFEGKETATRGVADIETVTYDGPLLTLQDSEPLCAHARFCMAAGSIWHLVKEDNDASMQLAIREASHCPSGRLALQSRADRKEIEERFPPSIGLVEDPATGCSGPLWVRGGIILQSEDGTPYEVRNRMTLCRCGASENKPFCNGNHRRTKFSDGLTDITGRR